MATVRQGANSQHNFEGKYIALDPAGGNKVIAFGKQSDRVVEQARSAGVDVPVIIYFPEKNTSHLY